MNSRNLVAAVLFCCIVCCQLIATAQQTDSEWKKLHEQAVNRQRRIIFNNDGNEPVRYCNAATKEELLRSRTAPLAGSQVDSIFYCTWSSGFGLFTHNTKVGQVFTSREAMFKDNRVRELLDKGIDPLTTMVEFAHGQGMEIFWSFRVNDTHDGARAEYGPVMFRANQLKQAHPEWLIGRADKRPRHGVWTAVDYGLPEIRELAFRYCEEVCQNYDVDGIELDFFRHAFLFKISGEGRACGTEELNQLTSLMQRIRGMTTELGRKRGRPILVAIRVPDSVEYCRFMGIDLEKWLQEGLTDLLIVSGYTQLNPWSYSVELGRKYGVKVYPSLDEPRVRDESARALRATLETYRGRALNALAAGMDGIYMFNFFDPHSSLWRELGDPQKLRQLDRNYFVSVRGEGSMYIPHQKFLRVPTLNPGKPVTIANDKPAELELRVGEEFSKGASERVTLRLQFETTPAVGEVNVSMNSTPLANGKIVESWLEIPLPHEVARKGVNVLRVESAKEAQTLTLNDAFVRVTE